MLFWDQKMNGKRCLVTGATGLVGSHLLLQLVRQGYCVRAPFRNRSRIEAVREVFQCSVSPLEAETLMAQVEWVEADLTRFELLPSLCSGVDRIFHVAGMVTFLPGHREELFLHNAKVTEALASAAIESGVDHFLYVSSVAVIDAPACVEATESMAWDASRHHSDYAASKYAAEQAVWRAASKGLKATVVNPSVVLAPGFWGTGSSAFFSIISKGLAFYPPGGTGVVDVRDVAVAMVLLSRSDCHGRRFILSGANVLYKELFETIAYALTVSPPRIALYSWMEPLGIAAVKLYSALTRRTMKVSPDMIRSSFRVSRYNGSEITRTIGLTYTPFRETIDYIAKAYSNALML